MENWKEVKADKRAIRRFLAKQTSDKELTPENRWLANQTLNYINGSIKLTDDQITAIQLALQDVQPKTDEQAAFSKRLKATLAKAKS